VESEFANWEKNAAYQPCGPTRFEVQGGEAAKSISKNMVKSPYLCTNERGVLEKKKQVLLKTTGKKKIRKSLTMTLRRGHHCGGLKGKKKKIHVQQTANLGSNASVHRAF